MLHALKEEISSAVSRFCVDSAQRKAILRALARPGFALNTTSQCRAGILTLHTYGAIKGFTDKIAISGAAAVEMCMEAAFMFDSIADQDRDDIHTLSYPEELALALTLTSCGSSKATEAALLSGMDCSKALSHFFVSFSSASAGQFLDAAFEKSGRVSIKKALSMTLLKSGSLGEFSSGFGASIATEDTRMIKLFNLFGFNLLTYMQLVDDLKDALQPSGQKSDLLRRKKTVPTVFFLESPENGSHPENDIMPKTSNFDGLLKSFDDSGARLFTAVVAEMYLNKSKSNLSDLAGLGVNTKDLENFVKSVEFTPEELSIPS